MDFIKNFFYPRYMGRGGSHIVNLNGIGASVVIILFRWIYIIYATSLYLSGVATTVIEHIYESTEGDQKLKPWGVWNESETWPDVGSFMSEGIYTPFRIWII